MSFIVTQQKCKACEKTVYPVDQLSADGTAYRKACFRCSHCKGTLKLSNYSSMGGGILYCKPYYEQLFKETGTFSKNFQSPAKLAEKTTLELVKNELPSTFKAYCYQQHRWSCGPANLFRKMVMENTRNKKVSLWKKINVIYSFFFVRKVVAHINTFAFYCIVLPATVLVPEVVVPKWGAVYIPLVLTLLNAVGTPRS